MQPPNQQYRIHLTELKAELIKRLGPERSNEYFRYLNKMLSLKLSKVEFSKVCFHILGRENVRLHNLLIRSILKNACNAKVPPPAVASHDCNANVGSAAHESTLTNAPIVSENGNLPSRIMQKPVLHCQEVLREADIGRDVRLPNPEKLPLTKESVDGFPSEDSRNLSKLLVVEDGKELSARSSLQAPLGIPLFSGSVPKVQRALPSVRSGRYAKSYDIGGLLDSESLRERMQQIAALDGLGGVSMDCANILNIGLDVYLKRLIRMSTELVGSRHGCNLRKNNKVKHHSDGKLVNGVLPSQQHNQVQHSNMDLEGIDEQRPYKLISLLDFKVAMQLNPQSLGEDWPLLLEKIYMHSFEE
ncbi:hypothetical protein PTKIN_Ptkin18bG0086700 [Pterospermum kingtungense]